MDPNNYWWNHGWRVAKGHSSRSCKMKKDKHHDGAIRTKTLGVSDINQDWVPA